jgi:hypothetical protein
MAHVKACAVITDIEDRLPFQFLGPKCDPCGRLAAGEFPGIIEQVLHRQVQQVGVAFNSHIGLDNNLNRTVFLVGIWGMMYNHSLDSQMHQMISLKKA